MQKRRVVRLWFWAPLIFVLGLFAFLAIAFVVSWRGEKNAPSTTEGREETDLERHEREEKRWGKFILHAINDLRQKALHPPSDEEVKDRVRRSIYGVDPYSGFKNKQEYEASLKAKDARYDGIGVEVAMEGLGARVMNVHMMSPAETADVRIGDVITHILFGRESISLANSFTHGREQFLQKNLGRTMRLMIRRENRSITTSEIRQVNAVIPSVDLTQRLLGDFGFIRIRFFSEHRTSSEFLYALRYLVREKGLHGLIIDLRGNLGGYLHQGIDCASFFLPQGSLLGYRYDRQDKKSAYLATSPDMFLDIPIVLLVDGNTASTSEFLVGALVDRENPRAVMFGSKTRAKGVGQITEELPDGGGATTVTSFELFTPNGNAIDQKGFTPDEALYQKYRDTDYPDQLLGAAINYLRDHQKNTLYKK